MAPSWISEVVKSKDRYILVDAPRASGKTTVAIDWAVRQTNNYSYANFRHRNVLYVCPTHEQAKVIFFRIMEQYNEHVSGSYSRDMKITFDWGGTIRIVSPPLRHQMTGLRTDAIVLDEPNHLSPETYMEAMVTMLDNPNRRMLAVSTGFTEGASREIKSISDYADVKYIFGEHDESRKTNKDYAILLRK